MGGHTVTAAEARAERAKKLRYKRPACLSLNWKGIREDLSEMSEDIGSAQWMDGAYDILSDTFGDDEESMTFEFQVAFSGLAGELEQMYEDMDELQRWQAIYFYTEADDEYDDPPMLFDLFFPAIDYTDSLMGYDIVEHDYYGIEPGLDDYTRRQAKERLKRLTKDQLIDMAGLCMEIARQYMSLRARYDGLNASINILKGRHEEMLSAVKGIERLYDAAERETSGFKYCYHSDSLRELDRQIAQMPDRLWVE